MTEYKVADEKDMEFMMNSRLCFHVLYYDHAYVLTSDRQKGASDECIHRKNIRRKGIAGKMLEMRIKEAWERGVTEISLDATKEGRPLYE